MNIILNQKFTSMLLFTAGVGSAIYFATSYLKSRQKSHLEVDPSVALRILKDFRREFFLVFNYLASLSNQVQHKLRSFPYHSHSNNITDLLSSKLLQKNTVFEKLVRGIQIKIYAQYGIPDNQDFANFCEEIRLSNESIDFVIKDIGDQFKKALIGVLEDPQVELPDFLDIETVLTTYHDLTVKSLEFLYNNLHFNQDHKSMLEDDTSYGIDYKQDDSYHELRYKILSEKSFTCNVDVHPEQLMRIAIHKYSEKSILFKECIQKYDILNKEISENLIQRPINVQSIQDKVQQFLPILNHFIKSRNEVGGSIHNSIKIDSLI